jgi:hypothetical protein
MSCRGSVRTPQLHQTQDEKKSIWSSAMRLVMEHENHLTPWSLVFEYDLAGEDILPARVGTPQLYFLWAYYFQLFYNEPSCINHFSRPTDTASLFMVGNLFVQYIHVLKIFTAACKSRSLVVSFTIRPPLTTLIRCSTHSFITTNSTSQTQ